MKRITTRSTSRRASGSARTFAASSPPRVAWALGYVLKFSYIGIHCGVANAVLFKIEYASKKKKPSLQHPSLEPKYVRVEILLMMLIAILDGLSTPALISQHFGFVVSIATSGSLFCQYSVQRLPVGIPRRSHAGRGLIRYAGIYWLLQSLTVSVLCNRFQRRLTTRCSGRGATAQAASSHPRPRAGVGVGGCNLMSDLEIIGCAKVGVPDAEFKRSSASRGRPLSLAPW